MAAAAESAIREVPLNRIGGVQAAEIVDVGPTYVTRSEGYLSCTCRRSSDKSESSGRLPDLRSTISGVLSYSHRSRPPMPKNATAEHGSGRPWPTSNTCATNRDFLLHACAFIQESHAYEPRVNQLFNFQNGSFRIPSTRNRTCRRSKPRALCRYPTPSCQRRRPTETHRRARHACGRQ